MLIIFIPPCIKLKEIIDLLILSGFPFQNLYRMVFSVLRKDSDLGVVDNKWTHCDIRLILLTIILPKGVKYLLLHVFTNFLIFSKAFVQLHSVIIDRFVKNSMPNRVKLVHPYSRSVVTFNLSLEKIFRPIQITLVFSLFIFKPDKFPYISRVFKADCKECWLPFNISVCSLLLHKNPCRNG